MSANKNGPRRVQIEGVGDDRGFPRVRVGSQAPQFAILTRAGVAILFRAARQFISNQTFLAYFRSICRHAEIRTT